MYLVYTELFTHSPLLLGDSDSLSVSYGMEPEQESLSIVSFKD